jgi:hypothetical protein
VPLIYIEFISRRPGVALEAFHAVAGGGQTGWAGDYDDDVPLLNLGRTWRMGPEPEYLTAWYSPSAGLELNLLIDRIGHLGPDPRGLAFWGAPSYGALDAIARELEGIEQPIRLVTTALYNDFGAETL